MGPKRKSPGRSKSPKKGEAVDNSFYTLPLNEVGFFRNLFNF